MWKVRFGQEEIVKKKFSFKFFDGQITITNITDVTHN